MLPCPRCGGQVPRVHGAPMQACPHCGLEGIDGPLQTRTPAPGAPPASTAEAGPVTTAARLLGANAGRLLLLWAPLLLVWFGANLFVENYAEARGLHTSMNADADAMDVVNYLAISILPITLPFITLAFTLHGLVAHDLARTGHVRVGSLLKKLRRPNGRTVLAAFVLTSLVSAGVLALLLPAILFVYWYLYAVPFAVAGAPTLAEAFRRSRQHVVRGPGRAAALAAVATFLLALVASYGINETALPLATRQFLVSAVEIAAWPMLAALAAAGMLPLRETAREAATADPVQPAAR